MKAKEHGEKFGIGYSNTSLVDVFGYQFYIYADSSFENASGNRLYIHIAEKNSAFVNTIDFVKQFKDTENAEAYIEKELTKVAAQIFSNNTKKKTRQFKHTNKKHELFLSAVNVDEIDKVDLVALEWEIQNAGMMIWRDSDKDSSVLDSNGGKFPILIFNNSEWGLATQTEGNLVDIEKFMALIRDYKKTK